MARFFVLALKLLALKLLAYLALVAVPAAFALTWAVEFLGLCRGNIHGLRCDSPLLQEIANFAFGIVLVTFFTGLPAILALIGLVVAVTDASRWWRRRRAG